MKRLPVLRSWNANQDLLHIWRHIANDSPNAADRMLRRINAAVDRLGRHPNLGERLPQHSESLRRIVVGNYAVFYEVRDEAVRVIRILHAARDWERLL